MKALSKFALLILLSSTTAWPQGTVYFYNHVPSAGLDAPVFNTDGETPLTGVNFRAQLYAGPTANSLAPVGDTAFFAAPQPGYWWSYSLSLDRTIPDVPPGNEAFLQVKVWSTQLGSTYDQVEAVGGKHGASAVFSVFTGGDTLNGTQPPSFPAFLTPLRSFRLTGTEPDIPEPGTVVLLLTGIGVLGLWRFVRRPHSVR